MLTASWQAPNITPKQGTMLKQVADHSLLIRWQGKDLALDPVLFVSHLDVVSATEGASSEWSQPPFGGVVHDK